MKIERSLPSAALAPFVKEYISIESDLLTGSNTLPDTSLVMAFRYRGQVQKMDEGNSELLPAAVISGLRKSARAFCYAPSTANLLVVLREGGLSALSRTPAHELFGISVGSENFFPAADLDEVLERLADAKTNRGRIGVVEAFLLRKLTENKNDLLVDRAVQLIKHHNGMIRIRELASSLNISQDPFEKRFRTAIGSSPKQYASIVRLRNIIREYPAYPSLTEACYAAGYFDQSHFIKDFRLFTGHSPKDFFKSSRYW